MLSSWLPRIRLAAGLLVLTGAAGCTADTGGAGGSAGPDGRVEVVTALYPLQFVAERVGGDAVAVTNLTKPGAEPHDLELTPQQVGRLSEAGLTVYLKGFQPAVDEAVEQGPADRAFDVAAVEPLLDAADSAHEHEGETPAHAEPDSGGKDLHVWLDPTRLATIGDRLAERLGQVDTARAADYSARAKALRTDLERLDGEYGEALANCQRREIITSHTAFGYLAARYKLEQVGISGLSPEAEPSPQRVAQVAREAREHGATTIFFETLVSPKTAETIAREVGAKTATLDPLEGLSGDGDGDYLSVMRTNLDELIPALGCK